ncbi:uncharacterized protein LOC120602236 [Pteropus medius]|uniref:uncharacterized protein LOC120602236 n=1 Tax=Pteropus vampyrus TaxID=132908 RepID=UPI00196B21F6|nr:uncharacterized protein LOC120602236 [Pteropus giganteus]
MSILFPTPLSSDRESPPQGDLVLQPSSSSAPLPVPLPLPGTHAPPLFPPCPAEAFLVLPPWGAGLCKPQLLDWRMNGWGRSDWPLIHPWESTSAGLRIVAGQPELMSFSLVGRGNGQGGGELGGNQHSKTAEKRSVRSSQEPPCLSHPTPTPHLSVFLMLQGPFPSNWQPISCFLPSLSWEKAATVTSKNAVTALQEPYECQDVRKVLLPSAFNPFCCKDL